MSSQLKPVVLALAWSWTAWASQSASAETSGSPSAAATLSAKLAEEYAGVLAELDGKIPVDCAAILQHAADLVGKYQSKLAELSKRAEGVSLEGTPFLKLGSRVVCQKDLGGLVHQFGEVSCRVRGAVNWTNFAIRYEQVALARAKHAADQQNWAEIQRMYLEFQVAVFVRQKAHQDLWALATGKAVVGIKDSYTGEVRVADELTAAAKVNELLTTVNSPIYIREAFKVEAKNFRTVDRLKELKSQQRSLQALSVLIDAELKHLAAGHMAWVENTAKSEPEFQQAQAISSLGWWNGKKGIDYVTRSLASDSAALRKAALAALNRFEHSSTTLGKLVDDKSADVRIKAAELAKEQVHDPSSARKVICKLLKDSCQEVRQEAYGAMEGLASLYDVSLRDQLEYVSLALTAKDSGAILDAIQWMEKKGDNTDQEVVKFKGERLSRLERHYDPTVKQAAQDTWQRLFTAVAAAAAKNKNH